MLQVGGKRREGSQRAKLPDGPDQEGEDHDRDDDYPDAAPAGDRRLAGKLAGDELVVIQVVVAAIAGCGNVFFPIAGILGPARLVIGSASAARCRPNRHPGAAVRTDEAVSLSCTSHESELTATGTASPCCRVCSAQQSVRSPPQASLAQATLTFVSVSGETGTGKGRNRHDLWRARYRKARNSYWPNSGLA